MCATTWVDLWFVADYRWDASSGGKVLKLQLDFVMALDDLSSFLTFKAMNIGEFSSTTIATSGEIGWCSTKSKMQCISELHIREASSIDVS